MIVARRRRSPRAANYRTGVWSGLGGLNAQGGWTPDPVPPPASYETCSPVDSACVARNLQKNIGHEQAVAIALYGHDGDGNGPLGYLDKAKNPYIGPTPVVPVAPSGGRVTFTSSRGGNSLQVGDTWLVSITGATPNTPVTVNAGGPQTAMGKTDANGNFSLSGTARTEDIGSWNELWAVGGLNSGAFQFTVSPAASGSAVLQTAQVPVVKVPAVPGGTLQAPGNSAGASASSTVIGGFDFSSISTWGWLAAVGVGAFLMFGKGGR